MPENAEPITVLYICTTYPHLNIVYHRDRKMIVDNTVVKTPAEYIGFLSGLYGGEYRTADGAKQKFIESLEMFKDGVIVRAGDATKLQKVPQVERVVLGGLSSRPSRLPSAPQSAGDPPAGKPAAGPALAPVGAAERVVADPVLTAVETAF